MKFNKFLTTAVSVTLAGLLAAPVYAGNGSPKGSDAKLKFNVNIVAHPNGEDADLIGVLGGNAESSGGHAIFIDLDTDKVPGNWDASSATCTEPGGDTQTEFTDEPTDGLAQDYEPDGKTRFYFTPVLNGKFNIVDRDATDGRAEIEVPVTDASLGTIRWDMWIRVLGKPGGCAEILGYAVEDVNPTTGNTLWWHAGYVTMNRKSKKSSFVDATGMFEVTYCSDPELLSGTEGVNATYDCRNSDSTDLSVFNSLFSEYFWEVNNKGVRLMQMRFTETVLR